MCKLFIDWRKEIHSYCNANGLDFLKVEKSGKCWAKDVLMLQHIDLQKGKTGLHDETPAHVTLVIRRMGNKLIFEQTEYTKRYLEQNRRHLSVLTEKVQAIR